jgi:hypothetical protein
MLPHTYFFIDCPAKKKENKKSVGRTIFNKEIMRQQTGHTISFFIFSFSGQFLFCVCTGQSENEK